MEYIERYDNLIIKYNSILHGYFYGYLSNDEYIRYLEEIKCEFNDLKDEMIICNNKELNIYVDKIRTIISSMPTSLNESEVLMKLTEYDFITDIFIDIEDITDKQILKYIKNILSIKDIYSSLNIINEDIINIMNNEINIKEKYITSKSIDLFIYTGGLLYSLVHIISTSYNDIEIKHPLVAYLIPSLFILLSIFEITRIKKSKNIIKRCNEKIKKLI